MKASALERLDRSIEMNFRIYTLTTKIICSSLVSFIANPMGGNRMMRSREHDAEIFRTFCESGGIVLAVYFAKYTILIGGVAR